MKRRSASKDIPGESFDYMIVDFPDTLKEPYTKTFLTIRKTTLTRFLYSYVLFFS